MSEKVLLPREVAEAIENVRKRLGLSDEVILYKTYINGWEAEWTEVLNANGDGNKAFLIAKALVNGYEIEETPEEKLRQYYSNVNEEFNELLGSDSRLYGVLEGIENTLDILGIEIPGINVEKDGD
jgi:hypothetical protein